MPFISHSQSNLGTGFFGKVGINVGSTSPTERLKVNGTSAFVGLGTFSGGLTATGTVSLPSTTSIGSVSSTEISYIDGVTSNIQTQIDLKLSTATAESAYARLAVNNNFTGTNLFLTPIFANSVSTSSYSSITGVWSNTGNLGVFSLRYNTKVGGSTVTWNPIRLDANGWVGIGMDPSQAFEVLGAAKFNSAITATSISASGATSALSFSSTNNMTSPKFTISGTGYIANGSDVSMGAGSTDDIVTYNTSGRIMFSTAGSVRATITNAGNFGIGTLAPTSRFEVSGTSSMRYNDGGQADGKYLRSNSTGIASWAFVALSEIAGLGTGVATFLATPSSANLATALTDETGTGVVVFNASPTLATQVTVPKIIGGTGTTSGIVFQTTTGVGTTGANMSFNVGNNGATNAITILNNGNVGIGTTSPNGSLQLGNIVGNRKIVLFETVNNDHEFYGFGINAATLRYQVGSTLNNHVFFAGTSSTTSQQLLSINGDQTVTYTPLTTSQINALIKVDGKMAYNADTDKPVWCNGTVWKYADGTNM